MIKAHKIYTGDDSHSHIQTGSLVENLLVAVQTIHFKETAAHSSYDWHPAPTVQYVITLTGTLEFETRTGEKFILRPGEILIATDTAGSGHKWRLIDDQPWKRAYITFAEGTEVHFVAEK